MSVKSTNIELINTIIANNVNVKPGERSIGVSGKPVDKFTLLHSSDSCVVVCNDSLFDTVVITEYNALTGEVSEQHLPKASLSILANIHG